MPPERLTLEELQAELNERMLRPQLQPPAWQFLLLALYRHYPPRSITASECAAEASNVQGIESMSGGVLRALRRSLLLYHPDKNRSQDHGDEWAGQAEQITRIATAVLDYYRRRIGSSADVSASVAGV